MDNDKIVVVGSGRDFGKRGAFLAALAAEIPGMIYLTAEDAKNMEQGGLKGETIIIKDNPPIEYIRMGEAKPIETFQTPFESILKNHKKYRRR